MPKKRDLRPGDAVININPGNPLFIIAQVIRVQDRTVDLIMSDGNRLLTVKQKDLILIWEGYGLAAMRDFEENYALLKILQSLYIDSARKDRRTARLERRIRALEQSQPASLSISNAEAVGNL